MLEKCFLAVLATISLSLLVRDHSRSSHSSQFSGTPQLSEVSLPKLVNQVASHVQSIGDNPTTTVSSTHGDKRSGTF
jgi:hypothetical protein